MGAGRLSMNELPAFLNTENQTESQPEPTLIDVPSDGMAAVSVGIGDRATIPKRKIRPDAV